MGHGGFMSMLGGYDFVLVWEGSRHLGSRVVSATGQLLDA